MVKPRHSIRTHSVLSEVLNERDRQDAKRGEQNHSAVMWLTILGEEVGEACKGALEGDLENYREEVIQVAAVAVAMVECLDRHGKLNP